jgi:hypothetical protein
MPAPLPRHTLKLRSKHPHNPDTIFANIGGDLDLFYYFLWNSIYRTFIICYRAMTKQVKLY